MIADMSGSRLYQNIPLFAVHPVIVIECNPYTVMYSAGHAASLGRYGRLQVHGFVPISSSILPYHKSLWGC